MISFDQFISAMVEPQDYPTFIWNGPFIANLTISEIDVENKIVMFSDGTPITFQAMEQNYSATHVIARKELGSFIGTRTQNNKRQSGL
ncbi:MAG: hypothetical protein HUK25_10150 [Treponema sp.]|nr:hypothetical protein [Treponema sp.]